MKKILGIDVTDNEFNRLFCEQAKGKELKIVGELVVAVEPEITEEELKRRKLLELENWFNNYFEKQLIQSTWQNDFTISCDKYFNCNYLTIEELKAKAEEVRNEIKKLRI